MKIHTTKKALADALTLVKKAVLTRSSNPTLTFVHVHPTSDTLYFSSTNLDVDMQVNVPAEVQDPTPFVVAAAAFAQAVKSLKGVLVELRLEDGNLVIASAGSETRLPTGDLEAYPRISFPQEDGDKIAASELRRALNSVWYAADKTAFQKVFKGVQIERRAGVLRAVSSDGYRVAICDVPSTMPEAEPVLIPVPAVKTLIAFLKDGDVELVAREGMLTVKTKRGMMNLRLLDGDFPNYERTIPKNIVLTATLSSGALKEAVKQVAAVADPNANNLVDLTIEGGYLMMEASSELGTSRAAVEVKQEGVESRVLRSFNAKFMLDALSGVVGDVCLSVSGGVAPFIMEPLSKDGYKAVFVVLRNGGGW